MNPPRRLAPRVSNDVPLNERTTLHIGGRARWFVEAHSLRDVADACQWAGESGLPLRVLGGGSNLLVDDGLIDAVVLSLAGMKRVQIFGHSAMAQCGAALSHVILTCASNGLAGPEGLAGIPGTLGGALAMNAGGRYAEIADFVDRVVWIDPDGELCQLYREEIKFGYRTSSLRDGVVVEAILRTDAGNPTELKERYREIMREKLRVQPYSVFSAGCSFKNPKGLSAGRLIDLAGCKGLRVGGAQVSDRHGNFIVNTGDANARDMMALLTTIEERVQSMHDIKLEREVQIWPGVRAA